MHFFVQYFNNFIRQIAVCGKEERCKVRSHVWLFCVMDAITLAHSHMPFYDEHVYLMDTFSLFTSWTSHFLVVGVQQSSLNIFQSKPCSSRDCWQMLTRCYTLPLAVTKSALVDTGLWNIKSKKAGGFTECAEEYASILLIPLSQLLLSLFIIKFLRLLHSTVLGTLSKSSQLFSWKTNMYLTLQFFQAKIWLCLF